MKMTWLRGNSLVSQHYCIPLHPIGYEYRISLIISYETKIIKTTKYSNSFPILCKYWFWEIMGETIQGLVDTI